jgi:ketosteroid isomerase-like protein
VQVLSHRGFAPSRQGAGTEHHKAKAGHRGNVSDPRPSFLDDASPGRACGILRRTMSEESTAPGPAELTRLVFEAVNQRDIDTIMSFFAADALLDGRAADELYEGRAAIRGFLDEWFGYFAELRFEVEEIVVLDDGVVLAVVNQEGRPVGVDGRVHQREGWAIHWSADGLLVRVTARGDIDEARAAAKRLAESRG